MHGGAARTGNSQSLLAAFAAVGFLAAPPLN